MKKYGFRTIYQSDCYINFYEYRATSNGKIVHLQSRKAGGRGKWITGMIIPADEFDVKNVGIESIWKKILGEP
jgi:hypothetical protein